MFGLWWQDQKENFSLQKRINRPTIIQYQIQITSITLIVNITIKCQAIQQRFKFDRIFSSFQYHFYQFLCDKHSKQTIQKSNRVSIMPVIQLIQAQNLMKKISATHKIDKETKTKMSISTHSLFNKVQQKMNINTDTDKLRSVLEIETNNQNKKDETNKQQKQTPNYCQFRIKTEGSNYYFSSIQQKKSPINIPNLCHLENIKKNSLSIFESKTPRLLLARSEKYNQKQPLTQRLMCTYLKKQNNNSKLTKSSNKA
ncbi:unnamed protein product [Paramecium primaurelia]|uniref:Uncharacterized protein n=1 Tax=Paramecium primaurelia TaxID=5886 RepID=A0A8S1JS90_PARPR|nr:unnamed protein product [Paramecium primaurelia]